MPQFSRPGGGGDVLRPHPDQDDGGLGLGRLQLGTLDQRLAVDVGVEEEAGSALTSWPDLHLARPDRRAGDVVDDAHAPAPHGVLRAVAGQRTEVAQHAR